MVIRTLSLHLNAPSKRLWVLIGCAFLIAILLLFAPPTMPQNGLLWDFVMALGYIALALLLIIPLVSTRVWFSLGGGAHNAPVLLSTHRFITYVALFYLLAHIVGSIIIEPMVIEYLKPSAPWGMIAAILASVFVLFTLVQSECRIQLKLGYKSWRIWHNILSFTIIAGSFYHIIEASYFVNSLALKFVLVVLALMSGVLIFLQSRDYNPINRQNNRQPDAAIPMGRVVGYASLFASLVLFLFAIPRVGNREELQALQCLLGAC